VIANIVVLMLTLAAAFGLSYWAYRARNDRSAYVGLYLLFGFPGLLLSIVGLAFFANGSNGGLIVLAVGVAMTLPLAKPVRKLFARFTSLDPSSPVDMVGLCLMLAAITFFGFAIIRASDASEEIPSEANQIPRLPGSELTTDDADDELFGSVSEAELVVQVVAEVGLAYAAVGWWFYRSFGEATARLGVVRPTWKTPLIAIGFVLLGFIVNAVAGILTQQLQPDIYDEIQARTEEITSEVQNPLGAGVLGISAGVGEELLLRGALQPKFGIGMTSILFALLHTQYGFSFVVLGLFGMSVLLGLQRKYFGTTAAIMTHAIYDIIAVLAQTYG
jgi:membrane protease YdiL (CAAX protease family)